MSFVSSYLRRTLLSRSGSIIVGYISLCVVIWFGGKFFGIDAQTRVFILIGLTLIIICFYLVNWIVTYKRSNDFSNAISNHNNTSSVCSEDIDSLKAKMEEAIKTLKTSDLGLKFRGNKALYALPWYMVIGPSAAGKSTLLRNSGLHFPYSHSEDIDIKGFGGTHNCDWWFSDEAVILDTAGRYTTDENDNLEWIGFLSLLKKYRKRMPINGIVIALSLSDILMSDNDSIDLHIKSIRERINELTSNLGFVFPLYIVFTKSDLLNGFSSFFNSFNENERNQVWGATIDYGPDEKPGDVVELKFKELYRKLCDMRIEKMSQYRNHQLKAEVYDFPSQFLAASDRLLDFIRLLFKDNPYQETPNFKGVYFTSGTQEGMPLQRVIGNLQLAFGKVKTPLSSADDVQKKSYFIKSLLTDVIFNSSVDALLSYRNKFLRRWIKTSVIITAISAVFLNFVFYSASYTGNRIFVNDGIVAVKNLYKSGLNSNDNVVSFMRLIELYNYRNKLINIENTRAWVSEAGLYRGDMQIKPLEKAIITAMEKIFLIPVSLKIESKLQKFSMDWNQTLTRQDQMKVYSEYYNTLKLYLSLTNPDKINLDILPSLGIYWDSILITNNNISETQLNASKASIPGLLKMYIDRMKLPVDDKYIASHWLANKRLVQDSRFNLRASENPEVLYSQFLENSKNRFKTKSINDLLKSRGSNYIYSSNKLHMVFTRNGWISYVNQEFIDLSKKSTTGDWVLGTEKEKVKDRNLTKNSTSKAQRYLLRQLRLRYFSDYAHKWYEFMRSMRIRTSYSISDTSNKLGLLSRHNGPYAELFILLDNNINLYEIDSVSKINVAKENALSVEDIQKNKNLIKVDSIQSASLPVKELDEVFKDLRIFTAANSKENKNEKINGYLQSLTALFNDFEHLRSTSEQERESEVITSKILGGEGQSTTLYKAWLTTKDIISGSEVKNRSILQPLLVAPIKDAWRIIMSSAVSEIENKWSALVVNEYDDRIRGRFPFSKQGPDATLDDVSAFFRPNDGVLWSYIQEHMHAYLKKRKGSWTEKKWLGYGPGFSKQFITALSSSKAISRSLFKRGSDDPKIIFHLYPVPTTGLSEIILESNGQVYRYRNEPQEWRKFIWPGVANNSGAKITGISKKDNIRVQYESQGVWGLFHLLSKANIKKQRGIQYLSVWNMRSYKGEAIKVKFKIRADRNNNILKMNIFKRLYIPKRATNKQKIHDNYGAV